MKIIITGASKGLGKSLALNFARDDHRLGLVARTQGLLNEVQQDIIASCGAKNVHTEVCDLRRAEDVRLKIPELITKMGGVDVLINNASVTIKESILNISDPEWAVSTTTGLDAAFFCIRSILPTFLENGSGHIINIGSLSSKIPLERGISYSASKHALNGFSKSLIHELHDKGIKICTIHPGAFTVGEDDINSWKMPASEVHRACNFVLNSHAKAFVEEIIVRPLSWPES